MPSPADNRVLFEMRSLSSKLVAWTLLDESEEPITSTLSAFLTAKAPWMYIQSVHTSSLNGASIPDEFCQDHFFGSDCLPRR